MSNERLHEIERIAPDIRAADERKFVKFGFRLQLGPKAFSALKKRVSHRSS